MKLRRRRSLTPRANWRDSHEPSEPLQGQPWSRAERSPKELDAHWGWRVLAGGVALLELVLLGWLWFGPALRVQSMDVTGAQHMTVGQVTKAAGLSDGVSIISVVSILGVFEEMSMPFSFIASTTIGLTFEPGTVPALDAFRPYFLANASAIWLLPALCTQTKRNESSTLAMVALQYPE